MPNNSKKKNLPQHHSPDGLRPNELRPDERQPRASRLIVTIALNFFIPVAQLIGGVLSNSMALISDAIHNFSDLAALTISYTAMQIGKKGASKRLTFGYQRAEIIGALLNVVILSCAVIFILIEAVNRLNHPEPISGKLVMIMAGIGIAGNGMSALLLFKDSKHNLNIKGAFLHMLGDFFTSLVVLINGAVLLFRPWFRLDSFLCFLIAAFILRSCWLVLKEAIAVLMNATPSGLDLLSIQRYLEKRPEIESAHYLHAWHVGNTGIAFSCHLTVNDQLVSETEILSEKIRHHLFHKFGIDHPVFQFETAICGNGNLLCEVSSSEQKKLNMIEKQRQE